VPVAAFCVNTQAPPDFALSPYPEVQLGMCDVVECAPSKICYAALMLVELLTWRCLVLEDPESLGHQVATGPQIHLGAVSFLPYTESLNKNYVRLTLLSLLFCFSSRKRDEKSPHQEW